MQVGNGPEPNAQRADSVAPVAGRQAALQPTQQPAAGSMGVKQQQPDAGAGVDASAAGPGVPPQPLAVPPLRCISRAAPRSYVLSGAADPQLTPGGSASMAWGLFCAVLAGTKFLWQQNLSWLQFSCVIILPSISLAACLALKCARPEAYRRRRLHLWMHPLLHFAALLAVSMFRSAADVALANKPSHTTGGIPGTLTFLVNLLLLSGMTTALAVFPVFQLPPVSTAAVVAVWTAILSATNGNVCDATLLQHPVDVWHMSVWYRALEPFVAPLEPLLMAAGIGSAHPTRRCHCVLAALQFWFVAIALPLMVARGQVRGYTAWRAEQRRLDQQRRREQSEAWGFGFAEPSSSDDSGKGTSEGSSVQSPGSPPDALRDVYSQLLQPLALPPNDVGPASAAVRAARPGRPPVRLRQGRPVRRHHPADWQYVWALRVLRMLRPTPSKLAALAMFASALGAWHRAAFP